VGPYVNPALSSLVTQKQPAKNGVVLGVFQRLFNGITILLLPTGIILAAVRLQ